MESLARKILLDLIWKTAGGAHVKNCWDEVLALAAAQIRRARARSGDRLERSASIQGVLAAGSPSRHGDSA